MHHRALQYRQQIVADPQQFALVRRTVGACLRAWGLRGLVEGTAMCVTEMLSNVHRHVDSPECELRLERVPEGVRAVVGDRSSAALPHRVEEPDCFAESGRGLFLLSRTADRWGSVPTATGKEVWVVLCADPPPEAAAARPAAVPQQPSGAQRGPLGLGFNGPRAQTV